MFDRDSQKRNTICFSPPHTGATGRIFASEGQDQLKASTWLNLRPSFHNFYKNLVMAGGFLYVIAFGAGVVSFDEGATAR